MVSQRTSTVTILFTDLVGSTEMLQRLGDDKAEPLRRDHFRLLRESVAAHGGREVKTIGDSFMVAFVSAVDAVGCAVTMQQAVRRHNEGRDEATRLNVRIGLHAGEPLRDEEDFFGTPVVVARRLCDSAIGGQILVSSLARGLVGMRGSFTFAHLGPRELKGIAEPVDAYAVDWEHAVVTARPKAAVPVWARVAGVAAAIGVVAAVFAAVLLLGGGDDDGGTAANNGGASPAPGGAPVVGDIAFVSEQDNEDGIWFVNTDGTGLSPMREIEGFDADLAWSPDGTKLAFTILQAGGGSSPSPAATRSGGGGGGGGGGQGQASGTPEANQSSENRDIVVMNIDGTGLVQLTNDSAEDIEPAWSPDSKLIAFTSRRDGNREIYVMNVDGTDQKRITNEPSDDFHPEWSDKGTRIAFTSQRDGNREIYTMNADGSSPVRLTNHEADDFQPAWSPDGTVIAFTSERDGNREIYIISADGSRGLNRLTNNRANDYHPNWSPDGSFIAFTTEREGSRDIWRMDSKGEGQASVTQGDADDSQPIWSPIQN